MYFYAFSHYCKIALECKLFWVTQIDIDYITLDIQFKKMYPRQKYSKTIPFWHFYRNLDILEKEHSKAKSGIFYA